MLGPPACDTCNVWLVLNDTDPRIGWHCPVCGGTGGTGYKWMYNGEHMYSHEDVPFLRFMQGKDPKVLG